MDSLSSLTSAPKEVVLASANAWTQLFPRSVASVGLPCKFVRISAPTTASPVGKANAQNVLIVASTDAQGNPVHPTTTAGAWPLPSTASGLNYEMVSDASVLWGYALSAGDAIEAVIGS